MEFLQYVLALLVTLGILVSVHELGHFVIAKASGVRILRFSIGFGRPLVSWFDREGTEYAIAAIPLGGYVRMLDERESEVSPDEAHRSFNRLSPSWRIAIAAGGPLANFLLAIVVYWGLAIAGNTDLVPFVAAPDDATPAAEAGLRDEVEIVSVDGVATPSWSHVTMALAARLGDTGEIRIGTRAAAADDISETRIPVAEWQRGVDEPDLLGALGFVPTLPAVVGDVVAGGPAARAALEPGDRIVALDDRPVANWSEWVEVVRAAPGERHEALVERRGVQLTLGLEIDVRTADDGKPYGFVGVAPLMREVRYGALDAVPHALGETWDKTLLTLDLLKKMVTGLVSSKNLSGPITIAKVAGDSARSGLESFMAVLALLSISLGVLNLLPVPILDGGHIVLCTAEMILRRPIPERVQAVGVQIGLALVGGMMLLAVYNDLTRLF
jgi:regulator of sigma E protease